MRRARKEKLEFERMPYLLVTAMSAQGARDLFGGSYFKTLCVGQADSTRYRFGARTYKLFRTESDWNRYQQDRRSEK